MPPEGFSRLTSIASNSHFGNQLVARDMTIFDPYVSGNVCFSKVMRRIGVLTC